MMGIYTQVFMSKMGAFAIKYFPIFLLGAIFGKLMEDSGAAKVIAHSIITALGIKHASLAIVLACGLLTYGGVSAFVVAFAVYPLAAALFREANLPKRFIPATIALGAFTFTMTCLPGTAQIHNIIPVSYFGTDMYAAPLIGVGAGLAMMAGGLWWINRRIKTHQSDGYGEGHSHEPEAMTGQKLPHLMLALLPIIVVVVSNFVLQKYVIPSWDTAYLAEAKFGAISVSKLNSVWSMIIALLAANLAVIAVHWQRFEALLSRPRSASAMKLTR